VAAAVLSGNRNFEGRINPLTKANYLASPMYVVAYALAGTVDLDLNAEPVGQGKDGPVYLRDIWPTNAEIKALLSNAMEPEAFRARYGEIYHANPAWNAIPSTDEAGYVARASGSRSATAPPPTTSARPARFLLSRPRGNT